MLPVFILTAPPHPQTQKILGIWGSFLSSMP